MAKVSGHGLDCFYEVPGALYPYGATDVDAEVGNQSLTADLTTSGRLSVFEADDLQDENQVNFFAKGYELANGRAVPEAPNDGMFVGVRYLEHGVAHFSWLSSWHPRLSYLNGYSPIVRVQYQAPRAVGISVEMLAFATAPLGTLVPFGTSPSPDAYLESFLVTRKPNSPVGSVDLVAYGNWNPTDNEVPRDPFADSGCTAQASMHKKATILSTRSSRVEGAAVVSWKGLDQATGRNAQAAVAMAWSTPLLAWQAGGNAYSPTTPASDPPDPYKELASYPYLLGDSRSAIGQPVVALETRLSFRRASSNAKGAGARAKAVARGTETAPGVETARATLAVAVSHSSVKAAARAREAATLSVQSELSSVERAWLRTLRGSWMPAKGPRRVRETALRALIDVLLAYDPFTGAIVASPDTQGPYEEDWPRDGAFIDAMLDDNGYGSIVTRNQLFVAAHQASKAHPVLFVPPGNWPMNLYPNGIPGGPVPFEIDETGYAMWGLWRHVRFLHGKARQAYARKVFPALARSADWLSICFDPQTGLQCMASEGDAVLHTETLEGAGPVLLGLRSAISAARFLGLHDSEVASWKFRADALEVAIQRLWDPVAHNFKRDPPASTKAGRIDRQRGQRGFEDGGALLWPVHLLPYRSQEMRWEEKDVYEAMESSYSSRMGGYEPLALYGLCKAWRSRTPHEQRELESGLMQAIDALSTPAGILGEFWHKWQDGKITPLNDMPQSWESALVDMDALCIYGARKSTTESLLSLGEPSASSGAAPSGRKGRKGTFPSWGWVLVAVGVLGLGVLTGLFGRTVSSPLRASREVGSEPR